MYTHRSFGVEEVISLKWPNASLLFSPTQCRAHTYLKVPYKTPTNMLHPGSHFTHGTCHPWEPLIMRLVIPATCHPWDHLPMILLTHGTCYPYISTRHKEGARYSALSCCTCTYMHADVSKDVFKYFTWCWLVVATSAAYITAFMQSSKE